MQNIDKRKEKISILQGKIGFHFDPSLTPETIEQLKKLREQEPPKVARALTTLVIN